tara:strand:+ start:113 stop:850 length:738 start_codon:yes stop_codon:yes gene_type:complete
MKILMLFIYSDDELYNKMLKLQQQYVHSHRYITSYFVQMSPNIEKDIIIKNDIIYVKGNESKMNILKKTIKALELLIHRENYDYVIRTNMSTVTNLNLLYEYCSRLPNKNIYSGGRFLELEWLDKNYGINDTSLFGTIFLQGCFIVFSIDIIKKIIQNQDLLDFSIIDDVSIGIYIKKYTDINLANMEQIKPEFCLDNLEKSKLINYSNNTKYVAYRNHRIKKYSYGNREVDIPEIANQIKCLYK